MTPVLSRAQMRAFDAHAIERCHVPSVVLMENAGRGATEALVMAILGGKAKAARAVVVCGTGNNGGDGLVIARRLAVQGAEPVVVLVGDTSRLSSDTRANLGAWRGIGGEVRELAASSSTGRDLGALAVALAGADVVVDALFGTGLDRPIEGITAEVVAAMNGARAPRFAVDLPSGLDADTGVTLGVAVEATVTATFAHLKLGLLTPNGARLAGDVRVVDIGVPGSLVANLEGTAHRIDAADVASWTRRRAPGAYKTVAGHVLVVGGSPGKVGAPQLAARGALRAGAGLVTIATWPDTAATIEAHALEVMTARLRPTDLRASLDAALEGKQAVIVGPGLGLGDDARTAVEQVLMASTGRVVVDADALTLFAGRPDALRGAKSAIVTPHPGEAGRLLGKTPAQVENDRFAAARALVAASGATVVLKGAHTVVAAPDGRLAISPIACAALATAGAGDVLGGIIAAFACALPAFEAACSGVMLHACAGRAWSRSHGAADRGMLASDIADALPSLDLADC